MKTKETFIQEHAELMRNYCPNPLIDISKPIPPHVFYEEFSVFDKTLISKSTVSLI